MTKKNIDLKHSINYRVNLRKLVNSIQIWWLVSHSFQANLISLALSLSLCFFLFMNLSVFIQHQSYTRTYRLCCAAFHGVHREIHCNEWKWLVTISAAAKHTRNTKYKWQSYRAKGCTNKKCRKIPNESKYSSEW